MVYSFLPSTHSHTVLRPQGTVRQLLHEKIRDAYLHPQFNSDVTKPLRISELIDQEVSGWGPSGMCLFDR